MTDAVRRSDADYAQGWAALLPSGAAWPREPETALQQFILGLSGIWGAKGGDKQSLCVDGRAADFISIEADPRATIEMLPDWEVAFGLPDSCLDEPLTIDDRHNVLLLRYTMLGAQDPAFLVGVAESIGYQIKILEHSPWMCGISQVGDTSSPDGPSVNYRWEIGPPSMRQSWTVLVLQPRLSWFRCGSGQCGIDPSLRIGIATDLECILNRIKPAHSHLSFDYAGMLVNGELAGTP